MTKREICERLRKAAELLDSADVQIHRAFADTRGQTFVNVLHLIETVSVAKFLANEAASNVELDDQEAK